LLLSRGAKIDATDDHGSTPLLEASWKGHAVVVRLLLERGANVNAATIDSGATALHEAAGKGHSDVVELLLSYKADPALKDKTGETAPEEALRNRQARVVGVFMDRGVISPADAGKQLKNAVLRGQTDMTTILLDRGVDPNPGLLLHDAALKGFVDVAGSLIAHGAKVNALNASGSTPLHDAALAGKAGMVEFLLSKGAEINARDRETGSTALHLAASWGRTEALDVLLKRGADRTIANKAGISALAAATANGHTEAAALLKGSEPAN
jgi:ankyrin repeat protein